MIDSLRSYMEQVADKWSLLLLVLIIGSSIYLIMKSDNGQPKALAKIILIGSLVLLFVRLVVAYFIPGTSESVPLPS